MAHRPNPHDAFFRQAFGSPKHVVGLLKLVLPKHLLAVLDLNPQKVRVIDPTHVDGELRGTGSDLIVEVPRRGTAGGSERAPAVFVLAIEHQRRDERFVVLRQLGYTVRIWERWLRDHPGATHLPPVIPVVIHNGDTALLPSMEIVLADLASPALSRLVLRARARATDADAVSETLLEILQGATREDADALLDDWASRLRPLHDAPAGWSTLVAALCYLAQVSSIPKPHLAAAADMLPEPTKEKFMTAAEEWMLEGLEKGLAKGMEKGLAKGREEGERAALAAVVLVQARLRFRDVPAEAVARIEAAPKPELERWIERILTAETLDDLFA